MWLSLARRCFWLRCEREGGGRGRVWFVGLGIGEGSSHFSTLRVDWIVFLGARSMACAVCVSCYVRFGWSR